MWGIAGVVLGEGMRFLSYFACVMVSMLIGMASGTDPAAWGLMVLSVAVGVWFLLKEDE